MFRDTNNPKAITFDSLKKVIQDLDEDMTDQQIYELLRGANSSGGDFKDLEKEEKKDKKQQEDESKIEVSED